MDVGLFKCDLVICVFFLQSSILCLIAKMDFSLFVFFKVVQKHYLGEVKIYQLLIGRSLSNVCAKNCES